MIRGFYHTVLEELSNNNMYNLVNQKSRPAVVYTARNWPRMFLGGSAIIGIFELRYSYYETTKAVIGNAIPLGKQILKGEVDSLLVAIVYGLMFGCYYAIDDSIPRLRLIFCPDNPSDKTRRLRQAESHYRYWKRIYLPAWVIGIGMWTHHYLPDILGSAIVPPLVREVIFELLQEQNQKLAQMSTLQWAWQWYGTFLEPGIGAWALRTLIKDLKGEPRTWWGGAVNGRNQRPEVRDLKRKQKKS